MHSRLQLGQLVPHDFKCPLLPPPVKDKDARLHVHVRALEPHVARQELERRLPVALPLHSAVVPVARRNREVQAVQPPEEGGGSLPAAPGAPKDLSVAKEQGSI
eukprot:7223083-Prymnesium_polylepis.1